MKLEYTLQQLVTVLFVEETREYIWQLVIVWFVEETRVYFMTTSNLFYQLHLLTVWFVEETRVYIWQLVTVLSTSPSNSLICGGN